MRGMSMSGDYYVVGPFERVPLKDGMPDYAKREVQRNGRWVVEPLDLPPEVVAAMHKHFAEQNS